VNPIGLGIDDLHGAGQGTKVGGEDRGGDSQSTDRTRIENFHAHQPRSPRRVLVPLRVALEAGTGPPRGTAHGT
jgi:hypothetical protein